MTKLILSLALLIGLGLSACSGVSTDYSDLDNRQRPNGADTASE